MRMSQHELAQLIRESAEEAFEFQVDVSTATDFPEARIAAAFIYSAHLRLADKIESFGDLE